MYRRTAALGLPLIFSFQVSLASAQQLDFSGLDCVIEPSRQVDLSSARECGVPVFNAPFSNTRSVAELVMAEAVMLLAQYCFLRAFYFRRRDQRRRDPGRRPRVEVLRGLRLLRLRDPPRH